MADRSAKGDSGLTEAMEPAAINFYHAHVYYDAASRQAAARLREALESRFEVEMGRWRDEPVGPHPQAMYQVKFAVGEFGRIVPWLMLNRLGLTILVHPDTTDAYRDHAVNALWLGEKLQLRLDVFKKQKSG
ncbi:MAG: DOPA 4,5-dioxygenase family protein [Candidatus Binataceae bacterium]